jgi:hypothetical protein
MAFIDSSISVRTLGSVVGTGECVALVEAWAHTPRAVTWHQGESVLENMNKIARGTAIATFVDGHYPNDDKHAAIFLYATSDGFRVIDQWHGQVTHERTIHFHSQGRQNDPNAYYVIE